MGEPNQPGVNGQVSLSAPVDAWNAVLTSGVQGLHEDPDLISRIEGEVRNFTGTGNLTITMTTQQQSIWYRLARECNAADKFQSYTPEMATTTAGSAGAGEKVA